MTVGLLPVPTDEQAMLLDASVRLMETDFPLAAVRARVDGGDGPPASYRGTAAELGWFGLVSEARVGGGSVSGNGVLDAALIAAERGSRLQPGPYPGHLVVVDTLTRVRRPPLDQVLADLVAGNAWATWAFGSEARCTLTRSGEGWRLDGTVGALAELADCEWLGLVAATPAGRAPVLVRLDAPGVSLRPLDALDGSRRWAAAEFVDVRVDDGAVLAEPGGEADALITGQQRLGAVLAAAETVGTMHADFALALQYAKDRIAFGRPIGSFQAIKHLLADTSLWLETGLGLVAAAATALGVNAPDAPELAHATKAFVADRSVELAHSCFQVFGGIGYTWEHDQHLYLRRIMADAEGHGTPEWHRAQLLVAAGAGS